MTRTDVLLHGRAPLGARDEVRFEALVMRRVRREPLAYVLGRWPFLDLELRTDDRALVPRPETEDLVLEALRALPADARGLALDVGTGSGCIAIALAAARPGLRVVASDRSASALALAAQNAAESGLAERIALVQADLVAPVAPGARAALVVANLPYVADGELASLEPEVREHEPRAALVAGVDGLDLIARLVEKAPARLGPGGRLVLEIAPGQADAVLRLLGAAPWREARIANDRFGRARIASAHV